MEQVGLRENDMKLVMVEWEDSAFINGWLSRQQAQDCDVSHCVSIGIVVRDDDNVVAISLGVSDNGNVCDGISIPKSCIKRIRELKVRRE